VKLFVANISFSASEEAVRELFEQVGPVRRLYFARDGAGKPRGFAFLEYESELDAARALDDLHGKDLMGRRLVVQESKDGGQR